MDDARDVNRTRWSMRLGTVLGAFVVMFAVTSAGAAMGDPGNGSANGHDKPNPGSAAEHSQSSQHQPEAASAPQRTSAAPAESAPPQSASTADDNGTGANTTGPYDSTRDGSPSENGSGDGTATGQPCAGCVGKADNKNPAGQRPGPRDANNGYECDGNSGVGKTNPAHSGCVAPAVEEPPTGEPTEPGAAVVPRPAVQADTLPRTGDDIAPLVVSAAAALIAGAGLLSTSRRLQRQQA